VQRLELGPVPSIRKEAFLRFSKLIIGNAVMMRGGDGMPEPNYDMQAD
jgi:hypothetical protein